MARVNVYTGVLLTAFALYFVYESLQLPFWGTMGPAAGALPLVCGLLFGFLSIFLVVRNLAERTRESGEVDFSHWRVSVTVLVALFVAVLLAKTLGMLLTIFLFMAFHTIVVEKVRWVVAISTSIATTVGFYLVFELWLDVPLVIGILGI